MDMTRLLPRVPDFSALTFRRDGHILIHQMTVDQFGLMGTKFVNLNFDPIEIALEITPSIDGSDAPYKVSKERSGALVIYARKFLRRIGILNGNGSRVLPVEYNREKGCIVAKLG